MGLPHFPLGPLRKPLRFLRHQLPPWNFITIHYTYFIMTSLITAIIFWGASTPAQSIGFTDALFMTISAMSEAGLNTLNISTFNTFQQILLFLLIMLGSAIWVSAFVVHARKIAFERKFQAVVEERKRKKEERKRLDDERRGREGRGGHVISRSRTFAFARSFTRHHDEGETGIAEPDGADTDEKSKELSDDSDPPPRAPVRRTMTRDSTPPARRGAPEMNGISSSTGETIMFSDDESEAPISPDGLHPRAITFGPNTRFHATAPVSAYDGGGHILTPAPTEEGATKRRHRPSFISMQGVGARPLAPVPRFASDNLQAFPSVSRQDAEAAGMSATRMLNNTLDTYLDTVSGWVSRNSQFHGLSEKERERLGGYEYRAVVYLSWIVPLYFVLWQLLGCVGLGAYVAYNRPKTSTNNGLNPWWTGAFMAVSAFNNSGMMTLDANMTAFQTSYYTLITMSLLILAGNTCYPVFLRLIVWCLLKISAYIADRQQSAESEWHARTTTLRFLLDHPRRCYTHLFPSQHNWWLLTSVISLNGIDWLFFEILNIGNKSLDLLTQYRVIDGLFQAFAVRSGGFYVVPIPDLRIGMQVLYVIMMYISAYPVVITMRNSNVYEERSLGLYSEDLSSDGANENGDVENGLTKKKSNNSSSSEPQPGGVLRRAKTIRDALLPGSGPGVNQQEGNGHFVRAQLRAQLAHDAWWIALALFIIMIIESGHFERNPTVFSVFNFLFEIVSAYGCVGISIGVPWAAYSFSGSWQKLSKLVLCAVMLRGRHRGLPVAIDKAVLLPSEGEKVGRKEEEDGWRRLRMGATLSRAKTSALEVSG